MIIDDSSNGRVSSVATARVHFMHLGPKIFGVDLTFLLA